MKLIYTVSEHSNPSGISLAEDRRGPLVDLARRWSKETPDLHPRGRGLPWPQPTKGTSLRAPGGMIPEGETVILARTFSKTFSPGMKLGFGVLPAELVAPGRQLEREITTSAPPT